MSEPTEIHEETAEQKAARAAAEKREFLARRRAERAAAADGAAPVDPTGAGLPAAPAATASAPSTATGPQPAPQPAPAVPTAPCAGCQERYESLEAQVAMVDQRLRAIGKLILLGAAAVIVSQFVKDRRDAMAAAAETASE
jgi:hypothetical protein